MKVTLLILAVVALVGCKTTPPPTNPPPTKNELVGTWRAGPSPLGPAVGSTGTGWYLKLNENNTFMASEMFERYEGTYPPTEFVSSRRHGRWSIRGWEIKLNYEKTGLVEWLSVATDYRELKLTATNRTNRKLQLKDEGNFFAALAGALLGAAISNNAGPRPSPLSGMRNFQGAAMGAAASGGGLPPPSSGRSRVLNPTIFTPTSYSLGMPSFESVVRQAVGKPIGELTEADWEQVTELKLDHSPYWTEELLEIQGLNDNRLTELPKNIEKLTLLTRLSLRGNKLTDVRGLEKLTLLTRLSLRGNKLTDVKGLENLTQLTELRLNFNQLTDVKCLEKLTKLETLWLIGNPALTKAQIDELQKALPKCKIISNPKK